MSKIAFIGDVHGDFNTYSQTIKLLESEGIYQSIQVGDFGIGFESPSSPIPYLPNSHRFIRGNHDDPSGCKIHPNWIPDGSAEWLHGKPMMFFGGARSLDRQYRLNNGLAVFDDEEVDTANCYSFLDNYQRVKPEIMVSHDAPYAALIAMGAVGDIKFIGGRTREVLSQCFDIHKPKLWVFGHHHKTFDEVIDGTRFVCVDAAKHVVIEI